MSQQEKGVRNCGRKCLTRSLRHEWLESRSLMAGDILDSPTDPNIDIRSGFADVRGALEYKGDVDVFQLDVSDQNSFSSGAWKVEGGDSLQLRVLDSSGKEVSGTVVDSSGWISLVGTAKGKYSLEISSKSNELTEYSVHISAWTAEPQIFPEVTPRPDDADKIGPDATVLDASSGYVWADGELVGATDKDVFAFKMPETGTVQIVGSPYRKDNAGFRLALFDATGVQYAAGEIGGLVEVPELAAGTYYVIVNDAGGASVGYSFFITNRFYADGSDGGVKLGGENEIPMDQPLIEGDVGGDFFVPTEMSIRMHNVESPADVDGDNSLTPLDALILINRLNAQGGGAVQSIFASAAAFGDMLPTNDFLDTNNDGYLSPLDVLLVINELNRQTGTDAGVVPEGEGSEYQADSGDAAAVDWSFLNDADDEDKPEWWCVLPMPEELFV